MTEPGGLVLIAEDEAPVAQILADYLQRSGFRAEIVEDGRQAVEATRRQHPKALLLDLMLPGLDGLEVFRQVRTFSQVPVLMITARAEELDRILGLEMGADDYICKPFSPREVVARLKTVLRRSRPAAPTSLPPGLELNETDQAVRYQGKRLDLTPTEYRLMRLFLAHPGRVFSRARLVDLAYDPDQDVSDRVIDSHVKNLRKKLAAVGDDLIHSVYGVGYRMGD